SVRVARSCTSSTSSRSTRSQSAGWRNSTSRGSAHSRTSNAPSKETIMSNAAESSFVYVTYIRTTPERLWSSLTTPEFMRQYWFDCHIATDWKRGSPWKLQFQDGRVADSGTIVEIDPPKRLVLEWRNEWSPEINAEGNARCTMDLEPV